MKLPITVKISQDELHNMIGKKALDMLGLEGKPYKVCSTLRANGNIFEAEVTISEGKNE
jgi:hypothetical protein